MLLVIGILLAILAVVTFIAIGFTGGNFETGESPPVRTFWPAAAIAVAAVGCFVLRHFLHGKSITW